MKGRLSAYGHAASLAAAVFAACYAGFILQGFAHALAPRVGVPALTLAALGLLGASRRASSRELGPRGAAATALTFAALGLVVGVLAQLALALPLTELREPAVRAPELTAAALALPVAIGVSVVVAGAVVAALRRRERPLVAALVRALALAAIAAQLALIALALGRAAHLPDPAAYVKSLPVVATMRPRDSADPGADSMEVLGRITLRRECQKGRCKVGLAPLRKEAPARAMIETSPFDAVALRHDRVGDRWILDASPAGAPPFYDRGLDHYPVALYRGLHLEPAWLYVHDLAATAAPPLGWIAGAALGAALAIAELVRRRGARRWLAEIEASEEGVLGDDGWVAFANGALPLQAPEGESCPPGPVIVVLAPGARGGAYRSEGPRAIARLLAGARAELAEAARAEMLARDARALACVALTGAPLVAAALAGLLGAP